jgi:hypothetical protein
LEDISKSPVFSDISRAGYKLVGAPGAIKVWGVLSVTTNLSNENI